MKEIKAIVIGAAGKMGSRIIQIIKETPSMKCIGPSKGRTTHRSERMLEKSSDWEKWTSFWKEDWRGRAGM